MYVEEKNRSWCSSNGTNDHQAITIEVANDEYGGNWHVSDKALNKLIELCIDICKRNNIAKLIYTGDATGNLTRHNMFVATTCPGPYLQRKFPYIVKMVNAALSPTKIKVGSTVKLKSGAKTYDGKSLASYVYERHHKVLEIKNDRVVITYKDVVVAAVKMSDLVII